ncbi:MAG: hypothetical protein ACFCU1_00535 [Sumerlaeia bacterium]
MTPPRNNENIEFPDVIANAQVIHPTFGAGKVLLRTGEDENSKAIVKFKEEGEKKIALRFANLIVEKPELEADAEEGFDEQGEEDAPVSVAPTAAKKAPVLLDEEEDTIEDEEDDDDDSDEEEDED